MGNDQNHEVDYEHEQRVQEILLKNPGFIRRYERMKELNSIENPGSKLTGLSDEQVEWLAEAFKETLCFDLPEDYRTFLKLSNGFNHNFESGRLHGWNSFDDCGIHPLNGGYVFGKYGDEGHYIYAAKKGIFYCFDRCSHEYERAFDSFLDMLDYMLELEVREGGIHYYDYEDMYDGEPDEIYDEYEQEYFDAMFVDDSEDDHSGDYDDTTYITLALDKAAHSGGLLVKALEKLSEADHCNGNLYDIGCPPLPMEYVVEMLMVANGMAWNGYEFYGTYMAKFKDPGFTLNDIAFVNEELRESRDIPESFLILGSFDEEYYVFDFDDLKYKQIDRMTLTVDEEFDSFEDLIKFTLLISVFDGDE